MPVEEGGQYWIRANIPVGVAGNRQYALTFRNCVSVDCGFSAKVPEGYKLVFELAEHLKDHGLEIYKNTIIGDSRVCISVRNLGREIGIISHRDLVATMRIEPVYTLKFKVKE